MIGITSGRKFKRGIHTGESIKKRWVLNRSSTYIGKDKTEICVFHGICSRHPIWMQFQGRK